MKKHLIIFSLLLFALNTQSQVLISLVFGDKLNSPGIEFGLEGGINLSYITQFESQKILPTFGLGFYFDIRLKNQISLSTGLLIKSNFGVNKLTDNDLLLLDAEIFSDPGNYRLVLNYFNVPVLIRYKFKKHIYVEAGLQAGLMYRSYIEFNSDHDGQEARIRTFNKDDINKIDVGAMVGLGYSLDRGMTLGVKYYYGFIDVIKNIPGTKNSSIFIKFNVPIGREKAIEKAAKEQ